MITENISTLKIHKLTQEQYDRELAAGNIDEDALYLTPEEETDLSFYATKEELEEKADKTHKHTISDITDFQPNNISRVQSDWIQNDSSEQDYIKNKPFGEVNITIEFNGDLTDETIISFNEKQYVHVSDMYISQDLLIGSTLTNNSGDVITIASDDTGFVKYGDSVYGYTNDTQNVLFVSENNATYESVTFTEKGTYFLYSNDNTVAQTVSLTKSEITKIDSKFLPGSALTNEQVLSLIDRVNELEKGIAKFG